MGLNFDSGSGGGKSAVFVDIVKIKEVVDQSGQEVFENTKYDLALEVTYDIGKEFFPKFWLRGNFKHERDEVAGWGSAFIIRDFINNTGVMDNASKEEKETVIGFLEKGKVPLVLLTMLKGREIQILKYVSGEKDGKLQYNVYKHTGKPNDSIVKLKEKFSKDVIDGYVKNFKPELVQSTTFDTGAFEDVTNPVITEQAPAGSSPNTAPLPAFVTESYAGSPDDGGSSDEPW